jgi:hypothetical protein
MNVPEPAEEAWQCRRIDAIRAPYQAWQLPKGPMN